MRPLEPYFAALAGVRKTEGAGTRLIAEAQLHGSDAAITADQRDLAFEHEYRRSIAARAPPRFEPRLEEQDEILGAARPRARECTDRDQLVMWIERETKREERTALLETLA